MRTRWLALFGLLVLSLAVPFTALAESAPVATVNGEPISREEFLTTLEQAAGQQILDQMINMRLILQAGRQFKLVDPKELEARVAEVKSQFATEEEFQAALAKNRITIAQLTEQFEARVALEKLQTKDAAVTDEEVKAYFDANQADLGQPEQVQASHILVQTEDEAKAVVEKLKAGADFGKLAAEVSIDPGSKESGGDLGLFSRGEMVKEFEDVAFTLKPGEVSAPVKTQFGFHIIKVVERKEAVPASFEENREGIRSFLLQQKAKAPAQVLEELKAKADVKVLWP